MFDDDDEDERFLKKKERVINGTLDSVLRGTGVWGAVIATLKNMAIKWREQREKGYNADESAVLMEMLNVSPPLGIKARKVVNAERTLNYNKKVIDEMDIFDIDNPMWSAVTSYIEATTNAPLNRLYNKTQNVRQSLNNHHTAFQRILMFAGWSQWNLGIGDTEKIQKVKEIVKEKSKIEIEQRRIEKKWKKLKEKYPKKSNEEIKIIIKSKELFDLSKKEQIDLLKSLNVDVRKFRTEKERTDKIAKLYKDNSAIIDSVVTLSNSKSKEQKAIELKEYREENKKKKTKVYIDPRKKYKRKGDPRKR
jgi:hypothetical protein